METGAEIGVPASAAWNLLIDTWRWPEWGPSVSKVYSPSRYIGHGTVGRVRTIVGLWLPFKVTLFSPPIFWSWEVAGIAATGHRVEDLGPERCRVVFVVPFIAMPYLLVCRMAANRIRALLEGEK